MANNYQKNAVYTQLLDNNPTIVRQTLIKEIEKELDGKLLTYTANPTHPFALIMNQDALLFEEMLRFVKSEEKGYLMINSPGGDANAAEKLLIMVRQRFSSFEVIVPNYAKSAATMVALGSDKILMGYMAELGPVDPQIQISSQQAPLPARSFIEGLESIRRRVTEEGDPVQLYLPLLSQIRPEVISLCQSAIDFAKSFVEKWLSKYMLSKDHEHAKKVAELLSTGENYHSHGKVIDFEEAKNILRLNVELIDKNSELWHKIWELHCRQVFFLQKTGGAKLFESADVSLNMNISIQAIPKSVEKKPLNNKT